MKEKLSNYIKKRLDVQHFKNISFDKIQVKSDHILIHINGGANGPGRWQDYLGQIDTIVRTYKGSYVVDIINDCPDDLWCLRLGWMMNDELKSMLPIDVEEFAKSNPGQWAIKVGEDNDYLYSNNGKTFCGDEDGIIKLIQKIDVGQAINAETGEVITYYSEPKTLWDSLSMETSCELFSLGIPHECATTQCIYEAPYRTAGIAFCPVFSLGDLLRLLPPLITSKTNEVSTIQSRLVIETVGDVDKFKYSVSYRTILRIGDVFEREIISCQHKQLTEALAELVKWCVSAGHINTDNKKSTIKTTAATATIASRVYTDADDKSGQKK